MQWQYLVHTVPADVISSKKTRPKELEDILNRYGSEGWELVSAFATTDDTDQVVLTFKRAFDAAIIPSSRSR
jgi:hypothetical protein